MCPANFDRGVTDKATWHLMETIGTFTDSESVRRHGLSAGALAVRLAYEDLVTASGLKAECKALVAYYANHPARIVGINSDRYRGLEPDEFMRLVSAAVLAGGKPTGIFTLRDGRSTVATFEVGEQNGIKTYLVIADTFDGEHKLRVLFTSIRVVCCNTLAMAFGEAGSKMAQLRHTSSLDSKVAVLAEAIPEAVKLGTSVGETFKKASEIHFDKARSIALIGELFPETITPAPTGNKRDDEIAARAADRAFAEVVSAARMPINKVGDKPGNLATIWNAATFLVDRKVDSQGFATTRRLRNDADAMHSMLAGDRGKRVAEIQKVIQKQIEIVMRDNTVQVVTASEARAMGIDQGSIDRAPNVGPKPAFTLADMLDN